MQDIIFILPVLRRKDSEKALSAGVRRDTREDQVPFNVSFFPLKPLMLEDIGLVTNSAIFFVCELEHFAKACMSLQVRCVSTRASS